MLAAALTGLAKSVQPTHPSRSMPGIPSTAWAWCGPSWQGCALGAGTLRSCSQSWDTQELLPWELGPSGTGTLSTGWDQPSSCSGNTLLEQSSLTVLSLPRELAPQHQWGSVCLHLPAPPNCSHDLNTFTPHVLHSMGEGSY